MARRPRHQRPQKDIRRGNINGWQEGMEGLKELVERIHYEGSGKHKRYPSPTGAWTPNHRPGVAACAQFAEDAWPSILDLLREAVRRSCIQRNADETFPSRVWAFINGVLHEARITNPELGVYHGFPLEYEEQWPHDPHELLGNAPRAEIPVI